MRRRSTFVTLSVLIVFLFTTGAAGAAPGPAGAGPAGPVGTPFTYQGQLLNSGTPVSGACDMAFRLFDDAAAGSLVGQPITTTVTVTGGQFTVPLDFGPGIFTGAARWLDIDVRCPAGAGGFSHLTPRQPLTAAPYAQYALSTGALAGRPLAAGAPATGQVLKWNGSAWAPATDNTGGGGAAWLLTGNAGTDPATNFLGTTDNTPLTLTVNGSAALRLVPNASGPNVIGGFSGNGVSGGVAYGVTIGGGGGPSISNTVSGANVAYSVIAGGALNTVSGAFAPESTIGGGYGNTAGGPGATIGGGGYDGIYSIGNQSLGNATTIGGGVGNVISPTTYESTIGGGIGNVITSNTSFIGGGYYNLAGNGSATIGGGSLNRATGQGATVGGGGWNGIANSGNTASGTVATIAGGYGNTASGQYATVPGGILNTASGAESFAAGDQAQATHTGDFVWADASGSSFSAASANQFVVRAAGGVGINTNSPSAALDVAGSLRVTAAAATNNALDIEQGGLKVGNAHVYSVTATGPAFVWLSASANITGTSNDSTVINNALTNGNPSALLFVTHNYEASSPLQTDPHPVGVWYTNGKWAIFNEDLGTITAGQAFNVLVIIP